MTNILVLAYQISPTKGSEYSVAWNYVTRMAKSNRITVLYGVSGKHMGDTKEMDHYADEVGIKNVRFICVKPNQWTNALNWCNRHDILQYTFYFIFQFINYNPFSLYNRCPPRQDARKFFVNFFQRRDITLRGTCGKPQVRVRASLAK